MLTLILGGARSGKSRLAQRFASAASRVCYVATAVPGDDSEMIERIRRHRKDRPESWRTVETPLALAEAVEALSSDVDAIIVDCLTIWLGNLCWEHRDDRACIETLVHSQIRQVALAARSCHVLVVSNEVGCGIVPEASVARAFRDLHGLMNQWMAEAADEVVLALAGLPQYLKRRADMGAAL
jgi:adenosylcobinamide kinase/adenosylcobinamide-phosphate guanylyltransferase